MNAENIREGAPYDDARFESLCREHGIWGTPESALCAVFWRAAIQQAAGAVPEGALIERIAQHWDGCTYDSHGEGEVDIGAAIRQNAKHFAASPSPLGREAGSSPGQPHEFPKVSQMLASGTGGFFDKQRYPDLSDSDYLAACAGGEVKAQWFHVDDERPTIPPDSDDIEVWTWDGNTVREDEYGGIYEQPAGPGVGDWVCVGHGFAGDGYTRQATHWALRIKPEPPQCAAPKGELA